MKDWRLCVAAGLLGCWIAACATGPALAQNSEDDASSRSSMSGGTSDTSSENVYDLMSSSSAASDRDEASEPSSHGGWLGSADEMDLADEIEATDENESDPIEDPDTTRASGMWRENDEGWSSDSVGTKPNAGNPAQEAPQRPMYATRQAVGRAATQRRAALRNGNARRFMQGGSPAAGLLQRMSEHQDIYGLVTDRLDGRGIANLHLTSRDAHLQLSRQAPLWRLRTEAWLHDSPLRFWAEKMVQKSSASVQSPLLSAALDRLAVKNGRALVASNAEARPQNWYHLYQCLTNALRKQTRFYYDASQTEISEACLNATVPPARLCREHRPLNRTYSDLMRRLETKRDPWVQDMFTIVLRVRVYGSSDKPSARHVACKGAPASSDDSVDEPGPSATQRPRNRRPLAPPVILPAAAEADVGSASERAPPVRNVRPRRNAAVASERNTRAIVQDDSGSDAAPEAPTPPGSPRRLFRDPVAPRYRASGSDDERVAAARIQKAAKLPYNEKCEFRSGVEILRVREVGGAMLRIAVQDDGRLRLTRSGASHQHYRSQETLWSSSGLVLAQHANADGFAFVSLTVSASEVIISVGETPLVRQIIRAETPDDLTRVYVRGATGSAASSYSLSTGRPRETDIARKWSVRVGRQLRAFWAARARPGARGVSDNDCHPLKGTAPQQPFAAAALPPRSLVPLAHVFGSEWTNASRAELAARELGVHVRDALIFGGHIDSPLDTVAAQVELGLRQWDVLSRAASPAHTLRSGDLRLRLIRVVDLERVDVCLTPPKPSGLVPLPRGGLVV